MLGAAATRFVMLTDAEYASYNRVFCYVEREFAISCSICTSY